MGDVRAADLGEVDLLARIAAAGFYDDPVMAWVFPDPAMRLAGLETGFRGLVTSFLPDRGTVHMLDEACVTLWRAPDYDYPGRGQNALDNDESPFPPDVSERFAILGGALDAAHPHETSHWYLNVISTLPERQGQGLGARTLQPVLAICDRDGVAAYLESSNPRNMTLYRRNGFEQTGEIPLPDGPSLYPMWREPR
jgi:GNAT superfamily N-acetyltransferase